MPRALDSYHRSGNWCCQTEVPGQLEEGGSAKKNHSTSGIACVILVSGFERKEAVPAMTMRIHIGTSGFSYLHWKGVFYPEKLPQRSWLEFYATRFRAVEINSSFYHLPRESVLESWYRRTPEGFTFVLKGSRTVTHIRRIKDCRDSVELFYERAFLLREKLGAVLWQLPPGLSADCGLLREFLRMLPARPTPVVEFRNPSWYAEDVYKTLADSGAAFCIHDIARCRSPDLVTAPVAYLRFHGTSGRYSGGYPDEHLRDRAEWIARTGIGEVYAFFNNDVQGHAVRDALTLLRLLEARVSGSR